jgi:hypothetical protein
MYLDLLGGTETPLCLSHYACSCCIIPGFRNNFRNAPALQHYRRPKNYVNLTTISTIALAKLLFCVFRLNITFKSSMSSQGRIRRGYRECTPPPPHQERFKFVHKIWFELTIAHWTQTFVAPNPEAGLTGSVYWTRLALAIVLKRYEV